MQTVGVSKVGALASALSANSPWKTAPLTAGNEGTVRVRGTRVTLGTVVSVFRQGCSGDRPPLPALGVVIIYSVIGYYLRHTAEVDVYLRERQREAEEIRRRIGRQGDTTIGFGRRSNPAEPTTRTDRTFRRVGTMLRSPRLGSLTVKVDGTLVQETYRYTRVWAREGDGGWRVVGGHMNAVPAM